MAYKLNWEQLLQLNLIERIARPWVTKKFKEYLGVEEPVMINLVLQILQVGNCSPD